MGKNKIGSTNSTTFLGSTDFPILAQKLYEVGSTASNLSNSGLSLLSYSSGGSNFTINSPRIGVSKNLVLDSTKVAESTSVAVSIFSGSSEKFFRDNSTAYAEKLYINMLPPHASVHMIGISTSKWSILSYNGSVQFSTAIGYTT